MISVSFSSLSNVLLTQEMYQKVMTIAVKCTGFLSLLPEIKLSVYKQLLQNYSSTLLPKHRLDVDAQSFDVNPRCKYLTKLDLQPSH